mgnify:CR=1 FL=1|jgi:hypothetical protein
MLRPMNSILVWLTRFGCRRDAGIIGWTRGDREGRPERDWFFNVIFKNVHLVCCQADSVDNSVPRTSEQ